NTTMGINRLSNILIKDRDDIVITTRMEHHSNDLPWRGKCDLKYLEVDENGRVKIDELEDLLIKYCGKVKYVTISGASNITGYLNDIRRVAKLAHKYGAHIIVDGAQLVAHKKVSMLGARSDENIDYLVFSGHKMYAPFGCGAIIGLKEAFNYYPPDILGGGVVYMVRDYGQVYLDTPEKNEPGTPNFFGVVAMAQAMKDMERIGFKTIEENERNVFCRLLEGMKSINNIQLYGDCKNIDDRL
ncbi:aminotransferase class V-fold PLP-dependent enzyme, partial [Clostridium saudiense]|nr:aminotransferase class V-fold PLP-dependent enzyme [Clostridium saudiense]